MLISYLVDIVCMWLIRSLRVQGIKYLVEKGLLNQTPEDVALFLFVNDQLDKGSVGEYLGEG